MDPDPYSEYGSGSTQVHKNRIIRGKKNEIEEKNSPFRESTDKKFLTVTLFSYTSLHKRFFSTNLFSLKLF